MQEQEAVGKAVNGGPTAARRKPEGGASLTRTHSGQRNVIYIQVLLILGSCRCATPINRGGFGWRGVGSKSNWCEPFKLRSIQVGISRF